MMQLSRSIITEKLNSYEIEFEMHGAKGASIHATFNNELFLYTCTIYIICH